MPVISEPPASLDAPAFAPAVLTDLVGDDFVFIRELLAVFLTNTPKLLEDLHVALSGGNLDALERGAHALRSGCHACGAVGSSERAEALETWCRTRRSSANASPHGAEQLVRDVAEALAEAQSAIEEYLRTSLVGSAG